MECQEHGMLFFIKLQILKISMPSQDGNNFQHHKFYYYTISNNTILENRNPLLCEILHLYATVTLCYINAQELC